MQEICHRDLKLENTLLDGSPTPRVKICDFGYSKVLYMDTAPALLCILTLLATDCTISLNQLQTLLVCFSVCFAAFETKINSWNSSIHSARGSFQKRVWWKGELLFTSLYVWQFSVLCCMCICFFLTSTNEVKGWQHLTKLELVVPLVLFLGNFGVSAAKRGVNA